MFSEQLFDEDEVEEEDLCRKKMKDFFPAFHEGKEVYGNW